MGRMAPPDTAPVEAAGGDCPEHRPAHGSAVQVSERLAVRGGIQAKKPERAMPAGHLHQSSFLPIMGPPFFLSGRVAGNLSARLHDDKGV